MVRKEWKAHMKGKGGQRVKGEGGCEIGGPWRGMVMREGEWEREG